MKRLIIFLSMISGHAFGEPSVPDSFLGLQLQISTIVDVKRTFGSNDLLAMPYGHHDKGLCYENGKVNVIYSTGPMGGYSRITGISISSANPPIPCITTGIAIPSCFESLCLGDSSEKLRVRVGLPFSMITDGEGYVASHDFTRKMTEFEFESIPSSGEYPFFDVTHSIWYIENAGSITSIGVYKVETN